jgi:hypothetical protein
MKFVGVLLTGWKPRFDGARGGIHAGILQDAATGMPKLVDLREGWVAFLSAAGPAPDPELAGVAPSTCAFLPLLPIRSLAKSAGFYLFGQWLCHHHTGGTINEDNMLVGWCNAFQALVYRLAAGSSGRSSGSRVAGDSVEATTALVRLIGIVAEGIHELMGLDPTAQSMLNMLREDEYAQDVLQRACSGVFTRRPLSQMDRLRIVEVALKRGFKHHRLLHDDKSSIAGIFAVVSVVPLLVGFTRKLVSEARTVELVIERRDRLWGKLQRLDSLQAAGAGAGAADEAGLGADTDGWVRIIRDKRRARAIAELERDATLLHDLVREGGVQGTSVDAFAELVLYCQRTDRYGRQVTVGRPADMASLGFKTAE